MQQNHNSRQGLLEIFIEFLHTAILDAVSVLSRSYIKKEASILSSGLILSAWICRLIIFDDIEMPVMRGMTFIGIRYLCLRKLI
jgi:hypothetical protein